MEWKVLDRKWYNLALVLSGVLLVAIATVDGLTSYELDFTPFSLLPIGLATWHGGYRSGSLSASLALVTWIYVDLLSGHPYSHPFFQVWAGIIHGLAFFGFMGAFAWLSATHRRLRATHESLKASDERFRQEIIEHRHAVESLARKQTMLERTEGLSHIGSWEWDAATGAVKWSDELFHIVRRDPAMGAPSFAEMASFFQAEDYGRLQRQVEIALQAGTSYQMEMRVQLPTGETRVCLARGYPHLDSTGKTIGLFGSMQDITEHKQGERERAELQLQLDQSQKMESLGRLVAGVAHNLNNVLAIAMGAASLREDLTTDPADRETYRTVGKVCLRGREVVKSLIHFAQPTLAAQAPMELNALIQEVCALLTSTARSRAGIVVALTGEPLWIIGHAGDINHVLVHLGINSLDAMPDGGTLTFRTAVLEWGQVEVTVEDNGTGMTPEVLAHALEPFYTTKEVGQGTGLGLSMAYGVIKAHGGTLDIASEPGQGTRVRLRFPRIPAPLQVDPPEAAAPALSLMKVFLVDDDEDVRFLMTRMLKRAGVRQVKVFAGGGEVLEHLPGGELPDLVILDLNMPGMDGVQTMTAIRSRYPDLPILISSGQPDIENWDSLRQTRLAVISKPFNMEEIRAKLAQFAIVPAQDA